MGSVPGIHSITKSLRLYELKIPYLWRGLEAYVLHARLRGREASALCAGNERFWSADSKTSLTRLKAWMDGAYWAMRVALIRLKQLAPW